MKNGCADGGQSTNDAGGAIYNLGTLSIENSKLLQNKSYGEGGGIYNGSGATLSISNSGFDSNSSYDRGNGGALSNSGNVLAISNSTFSANSTTDSTSDGMGGVSIIPLV